MEQQELYQLENFQLRQKLKSEPALMETVITGYIKFGNENELLRKLNGELERDLALAMALPADSANRGKHCNQDTNVIIKQSFHFESELRKALSDLDSLKASLDQERQAHQETKEQLRQRDLKIQSLESELNQARASLKPTLSPVKTPVGYS